MLCDMDKMKADTMAHDASRHLSVVAHRWGSGLTPEMRAIWRAVLARIPDAPVFLYPEWLETAAAAGMVRPAYLLQVRRDGETAMLLPLTARGPLAWAVPDPLCMDTAIRLIDPECADIAWAGVARAMRAHRGLAHLGLGRMVDEACLHGLRAAAPAEMPLHDRPLDPSYHVPLAAWPAYVAGLGRSMRDKLRRIETYLAAHPAEFVAGPVDAAETAPVLDSLIRLYRRRWGGQVGGSALCDAHTADFYRTVLHWAIAHDYGALLTFRRGAQVLAAGSALHIPGQPTAYFHLMARDEDPDPLPRAVESPGIVLTTRVVQWAIARGARTLCMGRGDPGYKLLLGATPTPLWQPTLARTPLADVVLPVVQRGLHLLTRLPVHLLARCRQAVG